ncbi:MAG: hypothetical protein Q7K39_01235 [Candidatus Magasanikbacteria bacterium]|nr:hypothetical protein [Candidatus Magasanikbacteria bacterium]
MELNREGPSKNDRNRAAKQERRARMTTEQKMQEWVRQHPRAVGFQTLPLDIQVLPCGHGPEIGYKRKLGVPIRFHPTQGWVCAKAGCGKPILLAAVTPIAASAPLCLGGHDDSQPSESRAE